MPRELTPEEKFAMDDPSETVPRDLKRGRPKQDIIDDLVSVDWRPDVAADYVDRIEDELRRYHESPESRRQLVREHVRHAVIGLIFVTIGVVYFVFSLFTAIAGQDVIILGGLTALGALELARGVSGWRRYRREPVRE